ncbi:MAG: endo-1,4-beta-xylanase [Oscillospiraceae bacterium]|jgi:endo-1,4-beta-xylanase|nr:endo-1,4-beta-xylanase [Oscillospiraceae bacterium]
MQKKKAVFTFILMAAFALSLSMSFTAAAREWDLTLPSLKEAFEEYFPIGNILEPGEAADGRTAEMFIHHYNFVTAENAMKPANIARTPGDWDFSFHRLDFLVDWALENDINVVGHTLVWHSQSADWLTKNIDGTPLTRAEARDNMERYINTVAGHFAGRIYSWDVVNEAFLTSVGSLPITPADEGWWRHMLRTERGGNEASPWFAAYANGIDEAAGEHPSDYIYDAFVFARLADPNAILYYNDFNETSAGKREAMAQMTEELNARWLSDPRNDDPGRLLVEGIGMQAHYWTSDLSPVSVELTIMRFAETGARVSITELDIPMGRFGAFEEATEENLRKQANLYRDLFDVFIRHADSIERVTFWGKADHQSWRHQGSPLLFDSNFQVKDSFHQIVALAQWLSPSDAVSDNEPEYNEPDEEGEEIAPPELEIIPENDSGIPWVIIAIAAGVLMLIIGIILINVKKV